MSRTRNTLNRDLFLNTNERNKNLQKGRPEFSLRLRNKFLFFSTLFSVFVVGDRGSFPAAAPIWSSCDSPRRTTVAPTWSSYDSPRRTTSPDVKRLPPSDHFPGHETTHPVGTLPRTRNDAPRRTTSPDAKRLPRFGTPLRSGDRVGTVSGSPGVLEGLPEEGLQPVHVSPPGPQAQMGHGGLSSLWRSDSTGCPSGPRRRCRGLRTTRAGGKTWGERLLLR